MKVKFFQQIKVACGRTGAIKEIKHAPHPLNIHIPAPQHHEDSVMMNNVADDIDGIKTNDPSFVHFATLAINCTTM